MSRMQQPVDDPNIVLPKKNEIPKWVKTVFWLYALFMIGGTAVTGIALASSALMKVKELLETTTYSLTSIYGMVAISFLIFALVLLVLQIFYGIGILRLRRWVLPLVLTFSFSTVIVGVLSLLNLNFSGVPELIGLLVGVTSMGFIGLLSIKYWNQFSGSARKLLVQVPLLLILLPFIIFGVLTQIFTDDPAINDSDLLLPRTEVVNQSDNAFYTLSDIEDLSPAQQTAFDQARDHYTSLEQGADIDISEASSTLSVLANVTDAFIRASKKLDYQCPSSTNKHGVNTTLCPLNELRDIAQVVAVRSYVELQQGNTEAALESALAPARLGNIVSSGQPVFIEHLVGIALIQIGVESVDRILDNSTVTQDTALRVSQELSKYQLDGSELTVSLKREYMSSKNSLKPFAEYSNYFYQHNKTLNEFADLMRQNIEIARTECGPELERKIGEVSSEMGSEREFAWWMLLKPNGVSEVLKSLAGTSLGTAREKECEVNEIGAGIQDRLKTISADR